MIMEMEANVRRTQENDDDEGNSSNGLNHSATADSIFYNIYFKFIIIFL